MISIIFIISSFILGFCFGGLHELKNSKQLNEEWHSLASKVNEDWSEYCESLIEKIKTLERSDTE